MTSGRSETERPDGFYWVQLGGETESPEIIEKVEDAIYRCGDEVPISFDCGAWRSYGHPIDITFLAGPLANPTFEEEA